MPRRVTRAAANQGAVAADDGLAIGPPAKKRTATKAPRAAKRPKVVSSSSVEDTAGESPTTVLTPDLIDQLVTKVADVVTQRLSTINQPAVVVNQSATPCPPIPQDSILQPPVDNNILQEAQPTIGSLVEEAVASSHEAITGICFNDTPCLPKTMFHSSSLEIDSRVNDKLKAKIWNNEYVEFNALISSQGNNRFQLSFQNLESSNGPAICLEPMNQSQKIVNINQWLQAFHVFVGVYTRRFPSEAPGLMKYCEIIQDLASRGFNWKFYDENFRFLRQSSASTLPWGSVHWEPWLRAQPSSLVSGKRSQPFTGPAKAGDNQRVPHGFCFKFHRGLDCAGCAFKHTCFHCQRDHRASQCNFRPQGKVSGKNTQFLRQPGPHSNKR